MIGQNHQKMMRMMVAPAFRWKCSIIGCPIGAVAFLETWSGITFYCITHVPKGEKRLERMEIISE
jgi:hypothetical protein